MKRHLIKVWAGVLLLSSVWSHVPAFAQQRPPAERGAGAPMMGWGHGMMGGTGMMGGWGPGMMMGAEYGALNLTQEQRNKVYAIHRSLRDKQFALMDRMHDSMQSVNFYRDGRFDEQAARNAYASAEKMHRQMFENMLDAQKQVDAVLTPQQRQQLSQPNR
jgi:Spy/CpxP family protein refolding chaperone